MAEFNKKQSGEIRDYKERFEFRFTVSNNIICQRYFKINNFNPLSLCSLELMQTIRDCGQMIDDDLKDKTEKYLFYSAPMLFKSEEEMREYFTSEINRNRMRPGWGIVIRDPKAPNYAWGKKGEPVPLAEKFDSGDFSEPLTDDDHITYKLAFYDNGREVCATVWDGVYPKYVRNSIDLSNRRGKLTEGDDPSRLNSESYVLYKMVEGKSDIVYKIIKEICFTCSSQDNSWYTTHMTFATNDGKPKLKKYDNTEYQRELRKETKRLEAYLNEQTSQ